MVNAVDDPDLCDVTVPAMIRRGPALIGVSTDGASPAAARFVREELERSLPGDVGRLVQQAAHARRELRETGRYRYDYPAWRDHFFAPGLASIRRRTGSLDEAGPGGAELFTGRGARARESADGVVYDRLVDPELLDLAPSSAIRIPVGKSKGSGTSQEEIHRLLVPHACAGDRVVRLKGVAPFVFGRGAEECEALAEAGIDHEVVPGVTSSIAAAELAGSPVTRRGTSASFTVLSGHRADDDEYDWSALAGSASTLVVMMASSTARIVAGRLLDAGCGPDDAAAFVHAAGRPDMRSVTTSLGAIATAGCPFPAPTVMIVGDVVAAPPVPGSTRSAPIPA